MELSSLQVPLRAEQQQWQRGLLNRSAGQTSERDREIKGRHRGVGPWTLNSVKSGRNPVM